LGVLMIAPFNTPAICVQKTLTVAPVGRPSSTTLPLRVTVLAGSAVVMFGPAFTMGAWFVVAEVHVTEAVSVKLPAAALIRSDPLFVPV